MTVAVMPAIGMSQHSELHSRGGGCCAGPGCDLVSPMSTVKGKGWRPREGIEKVLKLSPLASVWANRPQNFDRIQAVLSAVPAARDTLVLDTVPIHNMSFSGARTPRILVGTLQCDSTCAMDRRAA